MRELVTTVLDLLGGLLILAAVALVAWRWDPAAGLAVAGVGLVFTSWLGEEPRLRGLWIRRRKG